MALPIADAEGCRTDDGHDMVNGLTEIDSTCFLRMSLAQHALNSLGNLSMDRHRVELTREFVDGQTSR